MVVFSTCFWCDCITSNHKLQVPLNFCTSRVPCTSHRHSKIDLPKPICLQLSSDDSAFVDYSRKSSDAHLCRIKSFPYGHPNPHPNRQCLPQARHPSTNLRLFST